MTYPTSIDTAEELEVAINDFVTALVGAVDAVTTSITVLSRTNPQGQTLPPSGIVEIDNEIIAYASIDTTGPHPVLMGCTRGFDGTLAASHGANSAVEYRWVARHHNLLSAAIRTLEAIIGLDPAGSYPDVVTRLNKNEPLVIDIGVAATDWSFTHQRDRMLLVQLWELIDAGTGTYKLFDGEITQIVDLGGDSQVNITLPVAKAGRIVAN